jgi:hypothetical protein
VVGWVLILPPIRPSKDGIYVGQDGRPADVGIADPLFQWTVHARYESGEQCAKARATLDANSLSMDPARATTVSWSFAKCLEDNDPLLHPNHGPPEQLISGGAEPGR